MKKLICTVLLLCIVVAPMLVACNGGGGSGQTTTSSSVVSSSTPTTSSSDTSGTQSEPAGSSDTSGTQSEPAGSSGTSGTQSEPGNTQMSEITFADGEFAYDAKPHTISIVGNVPNGASVVYTGGEDGRNGATNVGVYTITVTITASGYATKTLTATLEIYSNEEPLFVGFVGNTVYFENSLDGNRLYKTSGGSVSEISSASPAQMVHANGKVYILGSSLLSKYIASFNPSTAKKEVLFEISADTIVTDGTYFYYNVNSLFSAENTGIYRVAIADLENAETDVVPQKLTNVKSDCLVIHGNYLYFANKSDGGKLYAITKSATSQTPVKIYDYKITEMIVSDGVLYFTRDITLSNLTAGAAIYRINVSGGVFTEVADDSNLVKKITMSKGKYLTKVGDYIYFVNTDMVTTKIFGDGVYKAPADGSGWIGDTYELLCGSSKVIDGSTDTVFGLTSDGTYLYYFRTSDKHLYRASTTNSGDLSTEEDLMRTFTVPERSELITTYYEKAQEYEGEIYYINMKDGGKLYKYNIQTQGNFCLTGLTVADFAVHDGYLYYATVRFFVNFDFYRVSLTGGEVERLSTEKCLNYSFANGKLYYTCYSGTNTLRCMELNGANDTILYGDQKDDAGVDAGATTIYKNKLYFVADSKMHTYDLTTAEVVCLNKDLKPLAYLIHNDYILCMNADGFFNHISIYSITTGEITDIDSLGASGGSDDIRGLFVYNNAFYYYRNVALGSAKKGLYRLTSNNGTWTNTKVDAFEGYYVCDSCLVGDSIYFMDVWQVKDNLPTGASTGVLCKLNLTTKQITKLT